MPGLDAAAQAAKAGLPVLGSLTRLGWAAACPLGSLARLGWTAKPKPCKAGLQLGPRPKAQNQFLSHQFWVLYLGHRVWGSKFRIQSNNFEDIINTLL
jgi:hypothetical protein